MLISDLKLHLLFIPLARTLIKDAKHVIISPGQCATFLQSLHTVSERLIQPRCSKE